MTTSKHRWRICRTTSPLGALDPMHGTWMVTKYIGSRAAYSVSCHTFQGACLYVRTRLEAFNREAQ